MAFNVTKVGDVENLIFNFYKNLKVCTRVKIGILNGHCICEHLFCDNFAERLDGSFSNIISTDEDGLTAKKISDRGRLWPVWRNFRFHRRPEFGNTSGKLL